MFTHAAIGGSMINQCTQSQDTMMLMMMRMMAATIANWGRGYPTPMHEIGMGSNKATIQDTDVREATLCVRVGWFVDK